MPSRRPRSDGIENRQAILAAAGVLYERRGPQVPLEEIAKSAGVSRTSVSRHFPDRRRLEMAMLEANLEVAEAYAREVARLPGADRLIFRRLLEIGAQSSALFPLAAHADDEQAARLLRRALDIFTDVQQSREAPEEEDLIVGLHLGAAAAATLLDVDPSWTERAWDLLERSLYGEAPRTDVANS